MNGRLAPESISLLLKPASSLCNLACDYCFYRRTEELYPGHATKMTRKILETVIRKTLSVASPFNSFCWQGGEPLLMGIDFFRDVAAFQKKYARPGQIIENSLQTNGLLLDAPWCEFLRKENFLVGVSLDGPAEIHNFYRKDYAGHGSFDGVMRGIGLMQEHEVSFNILCLLT
nr:radical SAM protein [Syntrophaceae bacterium]